MTLFFKFTVPTPGDPWSLQIDNNGWVQSTLVQSCLPITSQRDQVTSTWVCMHVSKGRVPFLLGRFLNQALWTSTIVVATLLIAILLRKSQFFCHFAKSCCWLTRDTPVHIQRAVSAWFVDVVHATDHKHLMKGIFQ